MNNFEPSENNTTAKVIWCLLLLLGGASLIVSSLELLSYGAFQAVCLAVAIITAFPANNVQVKMPNSKIYLGFQEATAHIGAIWFGIFGGVFLAGLGSFINAHSIIKDPKRKAAYISANITASFAASHALYFFLKYSAGFENREVAANFIAPLYLVLGVALMGGVYFGAFCLLYGTFLGVSGNKDFGPAWKEDLFPRSYSHLAGTIFALIIYASLIEFGIVFGLTLLPLSVVSYVIFRMQKSTLREKTKEITEASRIHLATVEALATAIDARDQVVDGHVRRVQILAVGLGEALGLPDDQLQALRTGSLLHDIGKLAIPDHILNKPGKLTPAEMEKVKIHPTVGAAILEKVNFNYPVIPAVKHHHENWDGTGYPGKLAGENIPITARILAIADSYDTIRGERAYLKAVSRDEARKNLVSGAGTKFDPKLINLFMRNLNIFETEIDSQGLSYVNNNSADHGEHPAIKQETRAARPNQGYVEQIKSANREVFTLYELARVFSSSLNLDETLSLFVRKIGELIPFDTCAIYIMDDSGAFATALYAEGKNAKAIKGRKVKTGDGASGYVLAKKEAIYGIDPVMDFSFNAEIVADYISMASLPLMAEERLIGAVSLYSGNLEKYGDEEMRLLETISKIAADAILKALSHAQTETLSLTDPMTGIPNARSLQSQFEKEVARAKRTGHQFQVIMLDLDGFKLVNDTFGHKIGDILLRDISKVIGSQLRDYDFLARYAGDEFVAILPETSHMEIHDLISRIEKAVLGYSLELEEDRVARVGVSIGAASYPRNGETLDQVLMAADSEMYAVKGRRKQKAKEALQAPASFELENPPPMPALFADEEYHAIPEIKILDDIPAQDAYIDDDLPVKIVEEYPVPLTDDMFIVELDESHIVSNKIN